jgi:hypothetical protein
MTSAELFTRARAFILEKQRLRAVCRRHEKAESEQRHAEIELFLDDAALHGLDVNNPADRAVIVRAWMERSGYFSDDSDEDFERRLEGY